jgi:hypothetical protein
MAEQRHQQPSAVAKVSEDGALADARTGGDVLHGHVRYATLSGQTVGDQEHSVAVACGVGAQPERVVGLYEGGTRPVDPLPSGRVLEDAQRATAPRCTGPRLGVWRP